MNILKLLRDIPRASLWYIAVMSSISGLAGGAVLAVIVKATEVEGVDANASEGTQVQLMLLFIVSLALLITTKRLSILKTTVMFERLLSKLRIGICDKIRRSDLHTIEHLDRSETFTSISQDSGTVRQLVLPLASTLQQAILLVAGLFYLAWLSPTALFLFLVVSGVCAYFYYWHVDELKKRAQKDRQKEASLFSKVSDILYGFKELRLSQLKNQQVFRELRTVGRESRDLSIESSEIYLRGTLLADSAFFLMLSAVVFILPQFSETYSDVLRRTTLTVMFIFGPLEQVIAIVPQLSKANVALERLFSLESRLDKALEDDTAVATGMPAGGFADFQRIVCDDLVFSYVDPEGQPTFSVGPMNLEIRRGEILFIVGGNGSGKSTFLKLIASLYWPLSGSLKLDDTVITKANRLPYHELFAGVFSDFYLFNSLYGVQHIEERRATELLEKMEIANKVQIVDGRFTTLDLSTGQRKRLALIASLLEDRRIYIFDEWTADQDPHFREHFYRAILPELRSEGKTVIAITHDDRYWDAADRVIKLDLGRIIDG